MHKFLLVTALTCLTTTSFGGPAECFPTARTFFTEYSYDQAMMLCKGSKDMHAIDCYRQVIEDGIFRITPVRKARALCSGSRDAQKTIACYHTAYQQMEDPRTRSAHALKLCSQEVR